MPTTPPEPLLTTPEVADLLQVNPKRVYRLLKEGLPGRRLGGEWRFVRREVLAWVEQGGTGAPPSTEEAPHTTASEPRAHAPIDHAAPPPLLAANGDVAVERLLALVNADGPVLGFVPADRDRALGLLERGAVLAAGSHGKGPPARLGDVRLARIHLVRRELGLVAPVGKKVPRLADLGRHRFAYRPSTAGVATHLERAARDAKLRLPTLLARAQLLDSHRDVVLAVARGDADVGLATRAWADRAGLAFRLLTDESYGLLVRAADLGDARVVHLCEVAQSAAYREALAAVPGYATEETGVIRYDPEGVGEAKERPPKKT